MKKMSLIAAMIVATACESYEAPESGLDCGRQFINATYQGNFKRARMLLAPGEENRRILEQNIEADFRNRNSSEKERLSNASIVITNVEQQGDTLAWVEYQNAYNNQKLHIACRKIEGEWKTDLTQTFVQPH